MILRTPWGVRTMPFGAKESQMERTIRVGNSIVLWLAFAAAAIMVFGYPILGRVAIAVNDGGILAATGHWSPRTDDGRGAWMHPSIFVLGALLCALATRYFMSDSWYGMAGGSRENCFYFITVTLMFMFVLLTVVCMFARHTAWHRMLG